MVYNLDLTDGHLKAACTHVKDGGRGGAGSIRSRPGHSGPGPGGGRGAGRARTHPQGGAGRAAALTEVAFSSVFV